MSSERLNAKFLLILFASALTNKTIASIMVEYIDDDEYLPNKEYQSILRAIKKELKIHNRIPTLGLLFQKFDDDDDVYFLLEDIEDTEVNLSTEQIIDELQTFLENAQFVKEYTEIGKLYNKNKKSDAVSRLKELSDKMSKFSIKKEVFHQVISGFADRNIEAMSNRVLDQSKYDRDVIFGIDELDNLVQGIERQQVICWMAASGGGKTKAMRFMATTNARLGANVLHIQLEGSNEEALAGYGASISGIHSSTLMHGLIDAEKLSDLEESFTGIEGEIYVRTFEQFAKSPTTADVHKMVKEVQKTHGIKVDMIVVDYMELLDTAGGQRWSPNDERHRRTKIADELKDIAVEFDTVVVTATQANDIPPSDLNNPSFMLTRHNVSEAKGIVKPLTMFLTINRTIDEIQEGRARIFLDKSRFTAGNKIFEIATDYGADRFYDRKRTTELTQIKE